MFEETDIIDNTLSVVLDLPDNVEDVNVLVRVLDSDGPLDDPIDIAGGDTSANFPIVSYNLQSNKVRCYEDNGQDDGVDDEIDAEIRFEIGVTG